MAWVNGALLIDSIKNLAEPVSSDGFLLMPPAKPVAE
jgi:hypothetical protein